MQALPVYFNGNYVCVFMHIFFYERFELAQSGNNRNCYMVVCNDIISGS